MTILPIGTDVAMEIPNVARRLANSTALPSANEAREKAWLIVTLSSRPAY
ncbi:hypothetical protein [Pseudoneobacillus sp. C159]